MFFKKKFKAPWDISLPTRMNMLTCDSHRKKVIYVYEKPDSSTFRYRVYNMCQALEYSHVWEGVYFFESELQYLLPYLNKVSSIVICRTRWSFTLDLFIEQAKKEKISVLFDIDDLIFNLDKIPLVLNTLNVIIKDDLISQWHAYSARLSQLGKKCDGTIGTNTFISNQLKQAFNLPNFIIPNFLNHQQIQASKELIKTKKRGDPFTLGYFSGSPSHTNDFAKIAPEVAQLLNEFSDMRLNVAGFMSFPPELQTFVKRKQIIHSAFVDFVTLQKKIASVDVNLVPLVDNEFTQCKSELKFFEAAIVGTVTLATPTHVFANNIQHAKTGYLCEVGDWYTTVKALYKNGQDAHMTEQANAYCLSKYAPASQLTAIESVLNQSLLLTN